ncbi:MAG: helix-turn-helix domain-containing protein [Aeromicrobium sp.]
MSDVTTTEAPKRRRPRDRKQQIVSAAAELFDDKGFHNVTMSELAQQVGITAGALYRHFSSKAELLDAVLTDLFERVYATGTEALSLEEMMDLRAQVAAEHPMLGTLWSRESRNLEPAARERHADRLRREHRAYSDALKRERPELSESAATFLAWAMLSNLAAPTSHVHALSKSEQAHVVSAACRELAKLDLPEGAEPARIGGIGLSPVSKREKILTAAGRLFGQHGYEATSVADIGAAADVTGPSLYTYFESKSDILAAVLGRADNALWIDLRVALQTSSSVDEALTRAVGSYIRLGRSQPYIISVLVADNRELPADLHTRQLDYLHEWVALLMQIRPGLKRAVAYALVLATIRTINDLSRTHGVVTRPDFVDSTAAIARAVLHTPV